MKTKVAFLFSVALLAGALLSASAVFAQTPPPHPDFAAMRAQMQQIDGLRKAERSQVLGALSSAHRAYLASIVGQLAIAANPDPKGAAAQLDAHLSTSEKAAILNADSSFRDQMRAIHEKMRSQMANVQPPPGEGPGGGPGGHNWQEHGNGNHHLAPDAGWILLRVTGGHDHGMMMHHPHEQ